MAKKIGSALADAVHPQDKDVEDDYETQHHVRTLIEAHGIMSDPKKMEKVHKLAGRHHKAIRSIQDIKDAYAAKVKAKHPPLGGTVDPDEDDLA